MTVRPCLGCGRLTTGSRCAACPRPTAAGYSSAERRRRAELVQRWREQHGETCPGWQRPAHAVTAPNRLSADHVRAVARGGQQSGPLQVLCVKCNGAKGSR